MSYLPAQRQGLGDLGTVVNAATAIVGDPCLGEVASLVLKLRDTVAQRSSAAAVLSPKGTAAPPKPGTSAPPPKGIGLCYAVKPIKGVLWFAEQPWRGAAVVGGVVGGIFLLGYLVGRRR